MAGRDGDATAEPDSEELASRPDEAPTVLAADDTLPASDPAGAESVDDITVLTREARGRYRIDGLVARGGQSAVYLAWDDHLDRYIAFKQPTTGREDDDHLAVPQRHVARFLHEARITARLEHPNIVPVYEIGRRENGSYYYTQKLIGSVEGSKPRTLRDAIAAAGTLRDRIALLSHFVDVCHAVAFAHEHAIIHRDIKPENVVLGAFGETVLLDWGLARERDAVGAAGSSRHVVGTPPYMSPEQAAGRGSEVDERSDVWSLGAMLYELLTGRTPFTGESIYQVLFRVQHDPVPPVRSVEHDAPAALAAVAEKALRRSPAERYQSASELARDIVAFQTGERVGVYDYSAFELARLFVARHRGVSAVTALALLLLVFATALILRSYAQSEAYLAEARSNLATAFVSQAREAERAYEWDRADVYYAAARVQDDRPEARWGAVLARNRRGLSLHRLIGHEGRVLSVAFSPDGRRLATAGSDRSIRIWDSARRAQIGLLIGHEDGVTGVAFSPDGRRIVSVGDDATVRLWNASTYELVEVVDRGRKMFHCVTFSPRGDYFAAGTDDGELRVYDGASGALVRVLTHPGIPIYGASFSPDGALVATSLWNGLVGIWDVQEGTEVRTIPAHFDAALSVAFSPTGRELASVGRDHTVRILRVDDGSTLHLSTDHTAKVYAVAFSPDGDVIATGSTDQTLRLWHVETGHPLVGESYGHEDAVRSVAFSPDGRLLAWTGSSNVWLRALPDGLGGARAVKPTFALAYAPGGERFAHGEDHELVVRKTSDLAEELRLQTERKWIERISWSSDGRRIGYACSDVDVCVHDTIDDRSIVRFRASDRPVNAVALSPSGTVVATGSREGLVRLWNVEDGAVIHTLEGHQDTVFALAWSPDGALLASGSYDKSVRVWDPDRGDAVSLGDGHVHGIRELAFSPDGAMLASASWDETVRLWDPRTGESHRVLRGHDDHVLSVSFSADASYLVSGAWDGTLRFWRVADGRELATFVTDEARVYAVAVSPDGGSMMYAGHAIHRLRFDPLGGPEDDLAEAVAATGLALHGSDLVRAR